MRDTKPVFRRGRGGGNVDPNTAKSVQDVTQWLATERRNKSKALWEIMGDRGSGKLLSLGRWQLREAVELITGHCDLREFQHKIGKASSPHCPGVGKTVRKRQST